MNDPIHFCPDTWPSGPVLDAFLDAFEARIRADERAVIEAEDARRWQSVREVVRGLAHPPRWAQFPDVREQVYRDAANARAAEQAKNHDKISFEKRAAA